MNKFESVQKQLTKSLGVPYYFDDYCAIFCVDTLKSQKLLSTKVFDLVITSPPYNIGKEYESVMPVEDYVEWTNRWTAETCRLIADHGALLLNIGYISIEEKGRAVPLPYLLWDKIPLYLNQEIVWNYSAGVACKKYLSPRNEKILWYVKDQNNYIFNLDAIRESGGPVDCSAGAPTDPCLHTLAHTAPQNFACYVLNTRCFP